MTSIGWHAFYGCGLTSVTIGNSVTNIDYSAFDNCYRLIEIYNKSSLNITPEGPFGTFVYNAKNIYTEEGGSKLSTNENGYVIYTDGDEKILVAYTGTETELMLPAYITQIYQYTFYDCNNLTSVTIPDGVTDIGYAAFSDCAGLTNVTITDSVTNIGWGAFFDCCGLTSITIPSRVTSIDSQVFYGCSSLTSITFNGTMEEWNALSKETDWNYNVPAKQVVCTDGTINI